MILLTSTRRSVYVGYCWASVVDGGPTLNQHRLDVFDGKGGHRTKIGGNETATAKTATDISTAMTSNCMTCNHCAESEQVYILNCENISNFHNFRVVFAICLRVHSLKIYAVCILYIMGEIKIGNTKKLFGDTTISTFTV